MTDTERGLLDKISRWDALWKHNLKLPISREEADVIRRLLRSRVQ